MKKLALGMIGLMWLGMAAPSMAADLPAQPYAKSPGMIPALYDWSGFYTGLNGGGGWSRNCAGFVFAVVGGAFNPPLAEGCNTGTGGTAGGQIGYRLQTGSWVYGGEAQGNWAMLRGSNINVANPNLNNTSRLDEFALFTGQFGYAFDNVLLYGKGGAAVTANHNSRYNLTTGLLNDKGSDTRWGGTVGAGVEYSFARNWSVAAEYDHLFMGTKDVNSVGAGNVYNATDRIKQDVDLATVRVNYRWGGPVISKY